MTALVWTILVLDVPEGGLAIRRAATEAERLSLVSALEILAVDKVELVARLKAGSAGSYHLDGMLSAQVRQACVVTFDPVLERLEIPLAVDFVPEAAMPPPIPEDDQDATAVDARITEPLRSGRIDLGDVVLQELTAALDPYPRLSDASLDRSEAGPKDDDASNPFASLRDLALPKQQT